VTSRVPVIALPGMDGTGELLDEFARITLSRFDLHVIPLGHGATYEELVALIDPQLPQTPFVLIAESFSGPLAVTLASTRCVSRLVLVNSFLVRPRWKLFRMLPFAAIFSMETPRWFVRTFVLNGARSAELVEQARRVFRTVRPQILARRMRTLLSMDEVFSTDVPTLYLRGNADRLVPDSVVRKTLERLPSHTIVTLDAPHLLLQCRAQEAWNEIDRFVS
jgi:pimeloyl-[acyl-carrier protein] methyl ester esterase